MQAGWWQTGWSAPWDRETGKQAGWWHLGVDRLGKDVGRAGWMVALRWEVGRAAGGLQMVAIGAKKSQISVKGLEVRSVLIFFHGLFIPCSAVSYLAVV